MDAAGLFKREPAPHSTDIRDFTAISLVSGDGSWKHISKTGFICVDPTVL